jgi:hypothetical protein
MYLTTDEDKKIRNLKDKINKTIENKTNIKNFFSL